MSNQKHPLSKDTVDEETIEANLKKMDYPATEDIMYQNKEVDADLETTDEQALRVDQVQPANG